MNGITEATLEQIQEQSTPPLIDTSKDPKQPTLFNVATREISPYWIDPNQPLKVPKNPLHFMAHKLQLMLERLEKQAENNPAQFNSNNYLATLEKFTKICEGIDKGATSIDEDMDGSEMGGSGNTEAEESDSEEESISMDL